MHPQSEGEPSVTPSAESDCSESSHVREDCISACEASSLDNDPERLSEDVIVNDAEEESEDWINESEGSCSKEDQGQSEGDLETSYPSDSADTSGSKCFW